MDEYKNVLKSFQNYFSKRAISNKAIKKNDFLTIQIEKLYSKIEANDLIIEENKYSQRDVDSFSKDVETILIDRSTTAMQKNKINQYLRQISNK